MLGYRFNGIAISNDETDDERDNVCLTSGDEMVVGLRHGFLNSCLNPGATVSRRGYCAILVGSR